MPIRRLVAFIVTFGMSPRPLVLLDAHGHRPGDTRGGAEPDRRRPAGHQQASSPPRWVVLIVLLILASARPAGPPRMTTTTAALLPLGFRHYWQTVILLLGITATVLLDHRLITTMDGLSHGTWRLCHDADDDIGRPVIEGAARLSGL
ncbi:hypothetical protein [Arboricoccus pini]|uniref:hypothetical protein n=1 Tax=Arboricoccus pini TaxID=1963835 RepID=UPI000B512A5E|nr:hypothetical protein [Arboricoccus pini]